MNDIKKFRLSLGFSQETFAVLLQVSRSTLAMAEKGKRRLPNAAYNKIREMKKRLEEEFVLEDHPEIMAAVNAYRKAYNKECTVKVEAELAAERIHLQELELELSRMRMNWEEAHQAMVAIMYELTLMRDIPGYEDCLDELGKSCSKTLVANSEVRQEYVEFRIRMSKMGISSLEQQIAILTGEVKSKKP